MQIENAKSLTKLRSLFSVNGEQGVLLWLRSRKEETFSVDVSEHFGLTPGRVANIIKKLKERGYIERQQDADDLRKVSISLTEEGKAAADVAYEQMEKEYSRLVGKLGEKNSAEWLRLTQEIFLVVE